MKINGRQVARVGEPKMAEINATDLFWHLCESKGQVHAPLRRSLHLPLSPCGGACKLDLGRERTYWRGDGGRVGAGMQARQMRARVCARANKICDALFPSKVDGFVPSNKECQLENLSTL